MPQEIVESKTRAARPEPRAYYNEIEPYAAAWLRNLIEEGLIPHGDVDERDIRAIDPRDLEPYTQCHFFAGLGGWGRALRLAGWPDSRPVWTGSCPCQPFSAAGKRKGFADERHLWPDWLRLIQQRRPAIIFGEQVASAAQWLARVRGDLEAVGYAVGAMPIEAASAGAPHKRDRYWLVAHGQGDGRRERSGEPDRHDTTAILGGPGEPCGGESTRCGVGDANESRPQGRAALPECAGQRTLGAPGVADAPGDGERGARESETRGEPQEPVGGLRPIRDDFWHGAEWVTGADGKARRLKPGIRLLAHGVPARVGKLRALGNAINPQAAAAFITAADQAIGDVVTW